MMKNKYLNSICQIIEKQCLTDKRILDILKRNDYELKIIIDKKDSSITLKIIRKKDGMYKADKIYPNKINNNFDTLIEISARIKFIVEACYQMLLANDEVESGINITKYGEYLLSLYNQYDKLSDYQLAGLVYGSICIYIAKYNKQILDYKLKEYNNNLLYSINQLLYSCRVEYHTCILENIKKFIYDLLQPSLNL